MATLVHPTIISPTPLDSSVPTPFPREQLAQKAVQIPLQLSKGKAVDKHVNPFEAQNEEGNAENPFENQVGPSTLAESGIPTPNTYTLKQVLPSINHVQKTCLMTLNNLLSERIGWHPIVPPRRHSMPSTPVTTSFEDDSNLPFALNTLVSNLRDDSNAEMIEIATDDSEANLLRELRMRVHSLSPSLSLHAAALTTALVELLINLHQLSNIQANVHHLPTQPANAANASDASDIPPPIDVFDRLTRQLGDLRTEHLSSQSCHPTQELSSSDLWSRIDADLENVVALCKQRVVSQPKPPHDVPPQYDNDNYDELESLPDYDAGGRASLEESKSQKPGTSQAQPDEKMRMDLESVAIAIERLYLVAPQLHNQRVELKSSKLAELEELERARAAASRTPSLKTCEDKDVRELEHIIDMIGRASARTMTDQSVILDGSMRSRIHKAKQKESDQRNAFVEQLFQHSEAGRIHNQDAEPQVKDPEALLTLPEFMREPLPQSERNRDGEALLSLPEFVREPIPAHISSKMSRKAEDSTKQDSKPRKRSRSLSAPPLAWLKSTASRTSPSIAKSNSQGFDVVYVAENHENLHHILLFFNIIGGIPEADVQAEVMPLFLNLPMDGGDHLFIKSGPHTSLPLMLPAHTNAGKTEVRPQRGHYEIKLMTRRPSEPPAESGGNAAPTPAPTGDSTSTPLLDASQLTTLNPVSFVCTSCSLPLIQSTKIGCYRDLPSEHWAELVESWMCHSDQKLNDHVAKHGKKGFWPSPGQALVGGSYILFEEGAMNAANLHISVDTKVEDDWHLARCLCGALIGRHQESDGHSKVYRVFKYAVRPVSPNSEPLKIPLSAFVVQDMMEFVQAHASYRFVIRDEEEEKPRILIWLFKPRIRLAYTSVRHHSIPKSANVLAAKVLFKLLGPNERRMDLKSILDKYPGFPQAEYLSYPMSACRQLASMLNDSNSAYPEGLRAMTGLEVGFLQRW